MPRPIFDIHEYELRGTKPPVYSKAQFEKLNTTLTRVNGQIDWTAQMLGFNGPNYWGEPNPKADGEYDWKGLVETMNEKRQMQVGAFGIYNKDQTYENWPSPFNRSLLKASGDFRFGIGEQDGKTIVTPLGLAIGQDFRNKPYLFFESEYLFRGQVEVEYTGEFFLTYETVADEVWTRFRTQTFHNSLRVKRLGSDAEPFTFIVLEWRDISDWNYESLQRNFIGIWGNKGNQLSHDFAFDALDLHGFNEVYSLNQTTEFIVPFARLLEMIGIEPNNLETIPYDQISIGVGGCGTFTLSAPNALGSPDEFMRCDNCDYTLIGTAIYVPTEGTTGNLLIELEEVSDLLATNPDAFNIETQDANPTVIGYIQFQYIPKNTCGRLEFPEVEFNIQIDVDNGTLEDTVPPWGTITNGIYDQTLGCITADNGCGETFCGFDNGSYDFDAPDEQTISICISSYLQTFIHYSMSPNLENCYTPLRLWKAQVLTTMDEYSYDAEDYWNPLIADHNTGPYPEDSYRHYVRLPLEYVRNGKWWNRAIAVCNNLSYFSAPPNVSETEIEVPVYRPVLYDEKYYEMLPADTMYYNEDYLVSTIREDNGPLQAFYKDSDISFESDEPIPFYEFSKVTEYDPFEYRIADFATTEWTGRYYVREADENVPFTGFLAHDMDTQVIEQLPESMNPIWDEPLVKRPDIEFPDESDLAHVKNYMVSYAYFVTDYSAADEPVFDPDSPMCWRDHCFDCQGSPADYSNDIVGNLATEVPEDIETDPEGDDILVETAPSNEVPVETGCFDIVVPNRTAYLLHNYSCV